MKPTTHPAPELPGGITITCKADDSPQQNLLVLLTLTVSIKNNYTFVTTLSNSNGNIDVRKSDLEGEVKVATESFPMDYAGIGAFTGEIVVTPMSRRLIEEALRAYDLYRQAGSYRRAYREDLETSWQAIYQLAPNRLSVEAKTSLPETNIRLKTESVANP